MYTDVQSAKCYKCQSGEFERNLDCESPGMSTAKPENCDYCYLINRSKYVLNVVSLIETTDFSIKINNRA